MLGYFVADGRIRIPRLHSEALSKHLDNRQIGCGTAQCDRRRFENEALACPSTQEFPDQPGLADARVADDTHDLTEALGGQVPAVFEQLYLGVSTNERAHLPVEHRRAVRPAEQAMGLPGEARWQRPIEIEAPTQERQKRPADQGAVRGRRGD